VRTRSPCLRIRPYRATVSLLVTICANQYLVDFPRIVPSRDAILCLHTGDGRLDALDPHRAGLPGRRIVARMYLMQILWVYVIVFGIWDSLVTKQGRYVLPAASVAATRLPLPSASSASFENHVRPAFSDMSLAMHLSHMDAGAAPASTDRCSSAATCQPGQ